MEPSMFLYLQATESPQQVNMNVKLKDSWRKLQIKYGLRVRTFLDNNFKVKGLAN